MSVDAIVHTEFPEGYTVLFGADGKVITTPRSEEHSKTIRSMMIDSLPLGPAGCAARRAINNRK